ncbi:methionine synthase reductase-like [Glandiceps talaboti]
MRVISSLGKYWYSCCTAMSMMSKNRFLLLYGSQTGQAQAIAEEIHQYAGDHGLEPDLHCLSKTEKKFNIVNEKIVVVVVSTTGDGDPPDTAVKFYRRLKKKTLPDDHLKHLKFTVLALGDSNYTNFCNNGKNFDRRFEQLGATRFYPSGFADDGVGLEIVVEPWIEGLWAALRKELNLDSQQTNTNTNTQTECISSDLQHLKLDESNNSEIPNNILTKNESSVSSPNSDLKITDIDAKRTSNKIKQNLTDISVTLNPKNDEQISTNHTAPNKTEATNEVDHNITSLNSVLSGDVETANSITATTDVANENKSFNQDVASSESANGSIPNKDVNEVDNTKLSSKLTGTSVETGSNMQIQEKYITDEVDKENLDDNAEEKQEMSENVTICETSLTSSCPPLSESALTLPPLPPAYLTIEYQPDLSVDLPSLPLHGGAVFPSATSPVVMATVQSAERLTRHDAVKTCLRIELDISNTGIEYKPGDSIGVVCPNNSEEVDFIIQHLSIQEKADIPMILHLLEGTKKKRAQVPEFVPMNCTLRHALLTTFDLRMPPKKAFIRLLAAYTNNENEKRRLQELCSRQGSEDYEQFIRCANISVVDILAAFLSCCPPIERLLEMLPRLQARPYSVSSSPLSDAEKLEFAFNVIEIPHGNGRHGDRQGVCTGWMNKLTNHLQENSGTQENPQIPIFKRTNNSFHLPDDINTPLIMIGPGTGVAPFIGFLQHRYHQQQRQQPSVEFGETWLFFGCRHRNRDYIFREQLEQFERDRTLSKLCVSFSRDGGLDKPRYVQDAMKSHQTELAQLVLDKNGIIYVCGDAKNMARDVNQTWTEILANYMEVSLDESKMLLTKIREERRYLEDIWT